MPLIWNNKEYMLVGDNEVWDKLEYVIARKLHIQYDSSKTVTVEVVKRSFEIYGGVEKIEIFRNDYSDTQFAHVTFKNNRTAYLALIDNKHNKKSNVVKIEPAYAHQQPDNPVDSSKSQFYNLPDKCLLTIFNNCDVETLGCLSVVCKKMSRLLRTRIFANKFSFEANTYNETEVTKALTTASHLLQCIDPVAFHLKICRNIQNSVEWPTISVDFVSMKRSKLSIDMKFLKPEWMCKLEPIAKRIQSIRVQCTVYDTNSPFNSNYNIHQHTVPDCLPLVGCLPKLETILIRNMSFKWNVKELCSRAKYLRNIYFENCLFDYDVAKERIIEVAQVVKQQQKIHPLCMIFDRIQFLQAIRNQYNYNPNYSYVAEFTYNEIQQAMDNEDVKNYVHIEIGGDPFSD